MYAVLIGRFYYTCPVKVLVRDLSVGIRHNSIARDCGDGEEFYVVYVSDDKDRAESFAANLEALPELWRPVFMTEHETLRLNIDQNKIVDMTSEICSRM